MLKKMSKALSFDPFCAEKCLKCLCCCDIIGAFFFLTSFTLQITLVCI